MTEQPEPAESPDARWHLSYDDAEEFWRLECIWHTGALEQLEYVNRVIPRDHLDCAREWALARRPYGAISRTEPCSQA